MGRKKLPKRCLGPYQQGKRWSIIVIEGSERITKYFQTETEAKEVASQIRRQLRSSVSLDLLIDDYETFLTAKNLSSKTLSSARYSLGFFRSLVVDNFKARNIIRLIDKLDIGISSKKLILKYAKQLANWLYDKGHLTFKTLFEINRLRVQGISSAGRIQLTLDESRVYLTYCFNYKNKERGIAAALPLVLGIRNSEVVNRRVKDIDGGGTLFRIPESKTRRGIRCLALPSFIQPYLVDFCKGKGANDLLFNGVNSGILRNVVKHICKIANITSVCPHGLRGTHATLAESNGATPQIVADALGHMNTQVGGDHYTDPNARQSAKVKVVANVLMPEKDNDK